MTALAQLKQAFCEAVDRKAAAIQGASSVRVDLKFNDDGTLRKVILFAEHDFAVRGSRKVDVERYEMNS